MLQTSQGTELITFKFILISDAVLKWTIRCCADIVDVASASSLFFSADPSLSCCCLSVFLSRARCNMSSMKSANEPTASAIHR
jgi:hypothetical protein